MVDDGHHTGSGTWLGKYSATLASDSANSATSSSRYNVRGGAKEADVAKADALRPISAELGARFPPLGLFGMARSYRSAVMITPASPFDLCGASITRTDQREKLV